MLHKPMIVSDWCYYAVNYFVTIWCKNIVSYNKFNFLHFSELQETINQPQHEKENFQSM